MDVVDVADARSSSVEKAGGGAVNTPAIIGPGKSTMAKTRLTLWYI